MARTNSLPNFLTDVADAIKEKKGSQADIPAANFDTEIRNLPGGSYQSKTVTITQNQSQTIIDPDTNYDAMSDVTVNVSVPEKQLQTKNYTFTQNTTTTLQPEQGYDGFDQVGIEINVQGGSQDPTTATADDILNPKTAYSNGQKITGNIQGEYEQGPIDVYSVKTDDSNNVYLLDYFPSKNIALAQTSTSPQTSLLVRRTNKWCVYY